MGHPGAQTPKKHKKLSFWDLILEDFLGHVFIVLRYIFEVRFRKAYGPPFAWFWDHLWAIFEVLSVTFLKLVKTLKNTTPPMRKHCFWDSEAKDSHYFLSQILRRIPEPIFGGFSIDLCRIWTPFSNILAHFLASVFQTLIWGRVFFQKRTYFGFPLSYER